MKRRSFFLLWVLLFCSTFEFISAQTLEMAVISDVHVMAPSLLVSEGPAFDEYMKHDRKMLKESAALLEELTEQLLKANPRFVFLTGDLTKDGEAVSHTYLKAHCLDRLKRAGIQTLVIPGNHDVNNPHAVSFDGDRKERVETVSRDDFARIYADYGYGEALARDAYSLSYVYQLTPRLRVLAIDACKYDENDFERDVCRHDGRIRPETMDFIKRQMADARRQGIYVIGMMHHGVIEHWKYQNRVIPGYVVDDWKRVRKQLTQAGLEILFTGHAHAQDIVCEKGFYDIETGSPVSYPSPYRLVTLKNDTLAVHTRLLTSLDFDTQGLDFQAYARKNTAQGFKSIAASMFPSQVPESLKDRAVEVVADAMSDHYHGDERLTDERRREIKEISRALRKYSFKWSLIFKKVACSLWSDKAPADHELLITLHN